MVSALVIGIRVVPRGDGILGFVPASLVGGGILIFAGLGMLDEGLVKSRKRLPWSEYGIILLIFIAILSFGLIEGVGVGMLATLVFFRRAPSAAWTQSHRSSPAHERESNKTRPVPDRAILLEEGERGTGIPTARLPLFRQRVPLSPSISGSPCAALRVLLALYWTSAPFPASIFRQ